MRLVFAGTPAVAVPALEAILASDHEVVAVVTRPDAQRGRGRQTGSSPIRALAEARGIRVLTPNRAGDPEFLEELKALQPDCCPVVAYGALLPREALAIPAMGWINLHFSLLPRWRGAAPVQHALLAGDEATGASVFRIEEGLDTGPVAASLQTDIHSSDTSGSLLDRLAVDGAALLVKTLDAMSAGVAEFFPQSNDGVTLAPKLTPDDARVDWTSAAVEVDRRIRGVTPNPGAWTMAGSDRLKVGPVHVVEERTCEPGHVSVGKREIRVGTGTTDVVLTTVQAQGKAMMAAADWARGLRATIGVLG